MGFLDGVGSVLGMMAAKAQEIQSYKNEYEVMEDEDLKNEYRQLKGKSGTEYSQRLAAVKSVLHERGYGQ